MTANYPWEDLHPQSGFVIEQIEWISDLDQQVLLYLYQPIIGPISYALYFTFFGGLNKEKYRSEELTHAEIMEQLVLGKEQFIRARRRLEAIGLLQVFQNNNQQSQLANVYRLRAPLTADNFFKDAIMSTLLMDRVGEQKYGALMAKFSIPDTSYQNWTEATATFQDVYHLPNQLNFIEQKQEELLVKTNKLQQPIKLADSNFSMPLFVELLQGSFISEKAITPEVREMTLALHQLYGYDEIDLQRIALAATDISTNKIDVAKYQAEALRQTREKTNPASTVNVQGHHLIERSEAQLENEIKLQAEQRQLWKKQGLSDTNLELAEIAKQYPPMEFVRSIKEQRGGYLTKSESNILADLLDKGTLSPAVLNIMIYYYLVEQKKNGLNRALMEKTGDDWGQNNIKTPEAALLYLKGRLDKQAEAKIERLEKQKYSNYRSGGKNAGHTEVKPDWFKRPGSDCDGEIKSPEKHGTATEVNNEAALKALIASRRKEAEK